MIGQEGEQTRDVDTLTRQRPVACDVRIVRCWLGRSTDLDGCDRHGQPRQSQVGSFRRLTEAEEVGKDFRSRLLVEREEPEDHILTELGLQPL